MTMLFRSQKMYSLTLNTVLGSRPIPDEPSTCHNPLGLGVYNGYNKIQYEIIVMATTILL